MFSLFASSDAQVIRQVLQGRRDRFAVLVQRYHPTVYGVALAHTGNRTDAEDVAQDVFLKAYQGLESLREAGKLGAWLITITRNRALDFLNKRSREVPLQLSHDIALDPPSIERKEAHELVWHHVQELDPDHREVLLLYYFSGKDTRKIAEDLGISVDSSRKRLQRARHVLGRELEQTLGKTLRPPDSAKSARRIMAVLPPAAFSAKASAGGTITGMAFSMTALKLFLCFGLAAAVGAVWFHLGVPDFLGTKVVEQAHVQPAELESGSRTLPKAQGESSGDKEEQPESAPGAEHPQTEGETMPAPVTKRGGGSISGIVRDVYGNLLREGDVLATQSLYSGEECSIDATGHFRLEHLASGNWTLTARPKGVHSDSAPAHAMVQLEDNQRLDGVEVVYPGADGWVLSGHVSNSRHAPVENATVSAMGDVINQETTTNERGEFLLKNLADEAYYVSVEHPNYTRARRYPVRGGSRNVDFTLEGFATLKGKVFHANTKLPVAHARVTPSSGNHHLPLESAFSRPGTVETDANGTFTVERVPSGSANLVVGGQGLAPVRYKLEDLSEGEIREGLTIELDEGAVLEFEVLNPQARPVEDARLHLGREDLYGFGNADRSVAHTDANGKAVISGLALGRQWVTVVTEEYIPKRVQVAIAAAGQHHEVRTIVYPGAIVRGTVLLDGVPYTQSTVNVSLPGQASLPATAAEVAVDGMYLVKNVIPGGIEAAVSIRQAKDADVRMFRKRLLVEAGEVVECNFVINSGSCGIEGYVTRNGEPAAEAVKASVVTSSGIDEFQTHSRYDGFYAFSGLPEGSAELVCGFIPTGLVKHQVQLILGQSLRQDFEFEGTAVIHTTVENVPEYSKVTLVLMRAPFTAARWDAGVFEAFCQKADYLVRFDTEIYSCQRDWEGLKLGTYWAMACAAPDWTNEGLAEAVLVGEPVEIVEGQEEYEVRLVF